MQIRLVELCLIVTVRAAGRTYNPEYTVAPARCHISEQKSSSCIITSARRAGKKKQFCGWGKSLGNRIHSPVLEVFIETDRVRLQLRHTPRRHRRLQSPSRPVVRSSSLRHRSVRAYSPHASCRRPLPRLQARTGCRLGRLPLRRCEPSIRTAFCGSGQTRRRGGESLAKATSCQRRRDASPRGAVLPKSRRRPRAVGVSMDTCRPPHEQRSRAGPYQPVHMLPYPMQLRAPSRR